MKQACVQWLTQLEKQPAQEGCEREKEIGAIVDGKLTAVLEKGYGVV